MREREGRPPGLMGEGKKEKTTLKETLTSPERGGKGKKKRRHIHSPIKKGGQSARKGPSSHLRREKAGQYHRGQKGEKTKPASFNEKKNLMYFSQKSFRTQLTTREGKRGGQNASIYDKKGNQRQATKTRKSA